MLIRKIDMSFFEFGSVRYQYKGYEVTMMSWTANSTEPGQIAEICSKFYFCTDFKVVFFLYLTLPP